jgi:hypothetical protein
MPGRGGEENRVEQMAIDLSAKREQRPEPPKPAEPAASEPPEEQAPARPQLQEEPETPREPEPVIPLRLSEQPSDSREEDEEERSADTNSLEIPAVFKREKPQKENFFVSKGQVITQLEDDMDIPTFLRKQMQ